MKKLLFILFTVFLITSPLQAGGNRWSSKPPLGSQIDWGHPLSKGLVACFLMNERGGNIVQDIANRKNGISAGAIFSKEGIYFSTTNNTYVRTGENLIIQYPFTLVVRFFPTLVTTRQKLMYIGNGAVTNQYFGLGLNFELNIKKYYLDARNTGALFTVSNTSIVLNKWHTLVGVYKSSTIRELYLDGKYEALGIDSVTIPSMDRLTFGRDDDSTPLYPFTGNISFGYLYNRALSPQEIQQLYIEPYCFIKPPTIWSNFKTAVVAGVIKTLNGVVWGSISTIKGLSKGSIKTLNGATAN